MKTSITTPSGIKLYYQDKPKRFYKVNGQYVPSVTEVLSVLDKPALVWWGMKIGVAGCLALAEKGILTLEASPTPEGLQEKIIKKLTEHKLTVNHVRDKAGERGVSAHAALEQYAATGTLVDPEDYPEHERGYVTGVLKFIEAAQPRVELSEVMVGSAEHEFAGRFDTLGEQDERELVTKILKTKVRTEKFPAGRYLWDLKTTKYVYDTHHLQLIGYEGGLRECGYEAADYRVVVLVTPDGKYEAHRTPPVHYKHFLAIREVHRAMKDFREELKRGSKKG